MTNYRKKLALLGALLILWIGMFFVSDFFIGHSMVFNITVNNFLSFSYPNSIQINDIYVSEQLKESEILTNSSFRKPLAQNFTNYHSLSGKFSFAYPSAFVLQEKNFGGSDVLYHIDFTNSTNHAHGFVQVWNMPYSLKEFLDASKSTSLMDFKSFVSKEVEIDNSPGYLWDYVIRNGNNYYKGMEVFFKKDSHMYRISYFLPEEFWNDAQSKIFWDIVHSFKAY